MKYRLIKEYIGSPDLGKTVIIKKGIQLLDTHILFNPEYWERVIEKDYEILSFKHKGSNHSWKLDTQLKEVFCIADGREPFINLEQINKYPKVYKIHSIKRLSDDEVFTVGDIDNFGKITGFVIRENKIVSQYYRVGDWQWLSSIQHIKKPLFKTFDGINIYENDPLFWVNGNLACAQYVWLSNPISYSDEFIKFKWFSTKQAAKDYIKSKQVLFTTEDGVDIFKGDKTCWINDWRITNYADWKRGCNTKEMHFSTKAKAEEYVLMNKPCLSIDDIKPWFNKWYSSITNDSFIEGLEKVVKSKL